MKHKKQAQYKHLSSKKMLMKIGSLIVLEIMFIEDLQLSRSKCNIQNSSKYAVHDKYGIFVLDQTMYNTTAQ